MIAAALIAEAAAVGVEFYLAGGALRYRGKLPEPLFARLWPEREAVRGLVAERCRGCCTRCVASPRSAEIGGADLNGWICDRCLARAGLLELVPERQVARLLAAGRRAVESPDALADEAEVMLHGGLS